MENQPIFSVGLETLDLTNIRKTYEGLDLLGESLLKEQQTPIIVDPPSGGKEPQE